MCSRFAKDQAGVESRPRPGARPASRESARDLERRADVGGIQGRRAERPPSAAGRSPLSSSDPAKSTRATPLTRIVSLPPVPDGPDRVRYRTELRPFVCPLSARLVREWTKKNEKAPR